MFDLEQMVLAEVLDTDARPKVIEFKNYLFISIKMLQSDETTGLITVENLIMKFLTVFSVIFIPLTFIAGIYGTNFEFVPELKYRYSYFIMWGVMIIVVIAMLIYFRRRKWL